MTVSLPPGALYRATAASLRAHTSILKTSRNRGLTYPLPSNWLSEREQPQQQLVSSYSTIARKLIYKIIELVPRRFSTTATAATLNSTSSSSSNRENAIQFYSGIKVGDSVRGGWTVLDVARFEEFPELTSYWLRHEQSGAEYYHIDAPSDANNCFCVTFKTLPQDSTGVAHILEHTTLCGSERYPVRDLFFNMYSRSLNTYMNAWTAPDHTSYPFATQNAKDFDNLLQVYLDATFFPRLTREHFMQEGHRLEYEESATAAAATDGDGAEAAGDADTQQQQQEISKRRGELKIKGVVYNEMKGAMGDPAQYFYRYLMREMYPGTIYSNNSGGEPSDIPNLTHEQLLEFHRTYYHPSNARFFSYGNLCFEDHLKHIEQHVMSRFSSAADNAAVDVRSLPQYQVGQLQRLTEPKKVHIYGPPDPMAADPERQTKMCISFLMNTHTDEDAAYETFSNTFFLNQLMLDEPRGPFYKNLIQSGLAPDFAPGTGYEAGLHVTSFGIGVQGVSEAEVETVESAIWTTFEQVARDGIDPSLVETALHHIELSLKTKSANFGISLCSPVMSHWLHVPGSPAEGMRVNSLIERLREDIASGQFFRRKIERYFTPSVNTHRVTMVMTPDANFAQLENEREAKRLAQIESELRDEDVRRIDEDAERLRAVQEGENLSKELLPTLTMNDVSRTIPDRMNLLTVPLKQQQQLQTLMINEQATNGIVYVSMLTVLDDFEAIPRELRPYLPLLTYVMTKMGARDMDQEKLAEQVERYTGGINASYVLIPKVDRSGHESSAFDVAIEMGTYCLERNIEPMIQLMTSIYTDPWITKGDMQYMQSLFDQMAISASNEVMSSGHHYAKGVSASSLTYMDSVAESLGGLAGIKLLNMLASHQTPTEEIAAKLAQLASYVLTQQRIKVLVTAENQQQISRTQKLIEGEFLRDVEPLFGQHKTLFADSENTAATVFQSQQRKVLVPIPSTVNFTSASIITVPFMTKQNAALRVASNMINSLYLHKEIREKGGAYGSSANIGMNGVFSYSSYRDPHIQRTLDTYRNTLQWLNKSNAFTDKDLEEAKLQTFQGLDSPRTPHAKPHSEFVYGITEDMRQERRNYFFEVNRNDILDVCNKYLDPKNKDVLRSVAVLGNAAQVPAEEGWIVEQEQQQEQQNDDVDEEKQE